jgi:glycosyltransferase involved in cell wall biosynthesis
MTTLRVILDEMGSPSSAGDYTREVTRQLIVTAPHNCFVDGVVSASPEQAYEDIAENLPGLQTLYKSALARRELRAAWQHGFTRLPGSGMVHAPSPLAPLARHDRLNDGDQIAVTFHDTLAWTHPEALSTASVGWYKAMAKRAQRFADAVVAPSHTVANELSEFVGFGDRIRVISPAGRPRVMLPADAAARANHLGLGGRYVLARFSSARDESLGHLLKSFNDLDADVSLLVEGIHPDDADLAAAVRNAEISADRVRGLESLDEANLAVAIQRAAVFAYPNLEEGFGMPVLEAMELGTPVVHSDDPALVELGGDAGLTAARGDDFVGALAASLSHVLSDSDQAERMRFSGLDRANAFTWRSAAEKVWQLHADL